MGVNGHLFWKRRFWIGLNAGSLSSGGLQFGGEKVSGKSVGLVIIRRRR